MKSNLNDVKREIGQFQNSMDDWERHCQVLLKSCFGMNFEDFRNFCEYVLRQRLTAWDTKTTLEANGGWQIGMNHVSYDLSVIRRILKIFHEDPDVRIFLKAEQ